MGCARVSDVGMRTVCSTHQSSERSHIESHDTLMHPPRPSPNSVAADVLRAPETRREDQTRAAVTTSTCADICIARSSSGAGLGRGLEELENGRRVSDKMGIVAAEYLNDAAPDCHRAFIHAASSQIPPRLPLCSTLVPICSTFHARVSSE